VRRRVRRGISRTGRALRPPPITGKSHPRRAGCVPNGRKGAADTGIEDTRHAGAAAASAAAAPRRAEADIAPAALTLSMSSAKPTARQT
jgi:hypothetical protein